MTEIEVRNQEELDAALEREDVKSRDALIVVCGDGRFIVKSGAPTMEAWGSSQPTMEAWGSSQPTMMARDSSQPTMMARGSSQPRMVAWGSSQPTMEARDSSQPTMEARDSSQPRMVAWGSSSLQGADPAALVRVFRQDYWSILDQAPAEVAVLREHIVDGKIDGSTYTGPCSCLAGTIATAHGCSIEDLDEELGIHSDVDRPAEQWFTRIEKGDTPLALDTEEWPSEGVFRISYALAWLDEWVESRKAIAAALEPRAAA
jgi:hypothetical protein